MLIKRISSDYLTLPTTLGEYVRHLHKPFKWTTTEDGSIVHLEVILDNVERYLVYMLTSDTSTRSSRKFVRSDRIDYVPLPFYASVTQISDDYIHLHSWTRQYNYSENCMSMFWDKICNNDNPSLWKNLQCVEMEPGYGKDYAVDPFLSSTTAHTCKKYHLRSAQLPS
jgi:hypothetical protein